MQVQIINGIFQVPKASHQLTKDLDLLDGEDCSLVYDKIKYFTPSATAHLCITGYFSTFWGGVFVWLGFFPKVPSINCVSGLKTCGGWFIVTDILTSPSV